MADYPYPNIFDESYNDPTVQHTRFSMYIIPDFIERALGINKLNTIDLLDYERARSVVNLHDFAVWMAIHELCSFVELGVECPIGNGYPFSDTPASAPAEFSNVVLPLVQRDPSVRESALAYLNADDSGNIDADVLPSSISAVKDLGTERFFHFKSIGETVLLNVCPGFLTYLRQPGMMLVFLREWVKELEKIVSPARIASQPLFKVYLSRVKQDLIK